MRHVTPTEAIVRFRFSLSAHRAGTKQASKVKQSLDLAEAKALLDAIDRVDAMWKGTGGPEKTRVAGRPG